MANDLSIPASVPGFATPRIATSPLNGPSIPASIPQGPPAVPGNYVKPADVTSPVPTAEEQRYAPLVDRPSQEGAGVGGTAEVGGVKLPFDADPYRNTFLDDLLLRGAKDQKTDRSLWDRFWLNSEFNAARDVIAPREWSIAGAAQRNLEGEETYQAHALEYAQMRPSRTPLELGVSVAGAVFGATMTPETLLFGPARLAAGAISIGGRAVLGIGESLGSRALLAGVSSAAVIAGSNAVVQAMRVEAGLMPAYDPGVSAQFSAGAFLIPAGLTVGGAMGTEALNALRLWLTRNKPAGQVLSALRAAGLTDDQIRKMTPEEMTDAIAKMPAGARAGAGAGGGAAGAGGPAPAVPGAPAAPKVVLTPSDETVVQAEVKQALDARAKNLKDIGVPPAEINAEVADIKEALTERIRQATILQKSGLDSGQVAAMTPEERAAAVARAETGQPVTPPAGAGQPAIPSAGVRAVPPELAPEVSEAVAPPNVSRATSPAAPATAQIQGKAVTFPDPEHARLYALGSLIADNKPADPAEAQALLQAFKPYAAISPTAGLFGDMKDLAALAAGYYREVTAAAAGAAGDSVRAGTALSTAEGKAGWDAYEIAKARQAEPGAAAAAQAVEEARNGIGGTPVVPFGVVPPSPGQRAGIFLFDPRDLKTDAKRFQFKDNTDQAGASTLLKGVTKWDADAAGQLMVWQDLDGTLYVADGHQRVALAQRLLESGAEKDILIPASLYRASDGFTADKVMITAALKNIHEGSGSIIDAAKVLRMKPEAIASIDEIGREQTKQSVALTRLSQDVWRMTLNKAITPQDAAVIGRILPEDHDLQYIAAQTINRLKPANSLESELLVNRVKQSGVAQAEKGAQGDLLGELTAPESTVGEEIGIVGRAIKTLAKDKNMLRRVAVNAQRIEQVGNKIAREQTTTAADEAGALAGLVEKVAFTKGEPRTALLKLAKEVKDGRRSINDAVESFIVALRRAERPGDTGGDQAGAGGRTNEAGVPRVFGADRIGKPGPRAVELPVKIGTGTKLVSQTGRELEPFPAVDFSTEGKTRNSLKRIDAWLVKEGIKEAEATNNDFVLTQFKGLDPKKLSQGDRDTLNQFIFGDANGATRAHLVSGEVADTTVRDGWVKALNGGDDTGRGSRELAGIYDAAVKALETDETLTAADVIAIGKDYTKRTDIRSRAEAIRKIRLFQQSIVGSVRRNEATAGRTAAFVEPRATDVPNFRIEVVPVKYDGKPLPDLIGQVLAFSGDTQIAVMALNIKRSGLFAPDKWSQGDHVEGISVEAGFRRKGVATAMYHAAERAIGKPLHPSKEILNDGLAFWKGFRPSEVGPGTFNEHVTLLEDSFEEMRLQAVRAVKDSFDPAFERDMAEEEAAKAWSQKYFGRPDIDADLLRSKQAGVVDAYAAAGLGKGGVKNGQHFIDRNGPGGEQHWELVDKDGNPVVGLPGVPDFRTKTIPFHDPRWPDLTEGVIAYSGDKEIGRLSLLVQPIKQAPWQQQSDLARGVRIDPAFANKGVQAALYDAAERAIGKPLMPSANLSPAGLAFWRSYRPSAVPRPSVEIPAVNPSELVANYARGEEIKPPAPLNAPRVEDEAVATLSSQKAVTPEETEAVATIARTGGGTGFEVATVLRGRPVLDSYGEPESGLAIEKRVALADAAIAKSTLTRDAALYRGLDQKEVEALLDLPVGTVIRDPSFLAASTDPQAAAGVSVATMLFEVPRGAHGIALDNADVVLPRNTRLVVTKIDRGPAPPSPQTLTPEFKTWFDGSKAVDQGGKPLVLFHGTDRDFEAFKKRALGSATGAQSAKQGFFFASVRRVAESYATDSNIYRDVGFLRFLSKITGGLYEKGNEALVRLFGQSGIRKGRILSAYLRMDNPLVVDFKGAHYRETAYAEILAKAKAEGHDGVILKNTFDRGFGNGGDVVTDIYSVFEPDRIKIADPNVGIHAAVTVSVLPEEATGLHGYTDQPGQLALDFDMPAEVKALVGRPVQVRVGSGAFEDGILQQLPDGSAVVKIGDRTVKMEQIGQMKLPQAMADDAYPAGSTFIRKPDAKGNRYYMVEPGADGKPQAVLSGAERISGAELAARRAAQPLRPRAAQTRDAGPLFGDQSQQLDLLDMARAAGEPVEFGDRVLGTANKSAPPVKGPDGRSYRIKESRGTFVGMQLAEEAGGSPRYILPPSGRKWTAAQARDAVVRVADGDETPVSPTKAWLDAHPLKADLQAKLKAGATEEELSTHPVVQEALERMGRYQRTDTMEGFNTPEWWANRKFLLAGTEVVGKDRVLHSIMRRFMRLAWDEDGFTREPVARGRLATIIIGPPASGKSTIANGIARRMGAAIVDSDEVKKYLPEYGDGIGANAVHEESDIIAKQIMAGFMDRGMNLVIPKVGGAYANIEKLAGALRTSGYKVNVVLMALPPDEAFRRMIGRFLGTSRLVNTAYARAIGYGPRDTYMVLKQGNKADGFATVDNSGPKGQPPRIVEDTAGDFTGIRFGRAEPGGQSGGANRGGLRPGGQDAGSVGAGAERGAGRSSGGAEHAFIGYLRGKPFRGETARPDVGIPATPGAPVAEPLARITQNLEKALGVIVRTGRVPRAAPGQAKMLGVFNADTGIIRLRERSAFDVEVHEAGHSWHLRPENRPDLDRLIGLHPAEVEGLAYAGAPPDRLRTEGFAEFFRLYVTNPGYAKRSAPGFTAEFEAWMQNGHPNVLEGIKQAQKDWYTWWHDTPSQDVVIGDIVTSGQPPLLTRIGKELAPDRLPNGRSLYGIFSRAYTWLVEAAFPWARWTEAAQYLHWRETGEVLNVKRIEDPHALLRLMPHAYQAGHIDLSRGVVPYRGGIDGMHVNPVGPSLAEAIELAVGKNWFQTWRSDELLAFDAYLTSRRMIAEYQRYATGEITNTPGKLSELDYRQAVIDLEKANPRFKQAADLIYQYQDNMLQKKFDAGLISKDFLDGARAKSDYVPAHRDFSEEMDNVLKTRGDRQNKTSVMQTFRGSLRSVISPLEMIMQDSYATAMKIAYNDTVNAIDTLAKKAGAWGGVLAERIPASELKPISVDIMAALKAAGKEAGLNKPEIEDLLLQASVRLDADSFFTTIFKRADVNEKGERIVYGWKGGERYALRLPDGRFGADLFEALTKIGTEQSNWLIEVLAVPATARRIGITTNPGFMLANYLRDQTSAFVQHFKYIPLASGARGVVDELAQTDMARMAAQSGMLFGGAAVASLSEARIGRSIAALQKTGYTIKRMKSLPEFLKLTEVTETGTRIALFRDYYETAVRQGLTKAEALVEAGFESNDYMDFSRYGSKTLMLRRVITFLNAAVQGTDKVARILVPDMIRPLAKVFRGEPLTKLESYNLGRSAQAWVKIVSITALSATYAAMMKDEPEYQDAAEYLRATNWLLKGPGGEWYVIPKPYEIATVFNFGERMVDAIAAKDPTWFGKWLASWSYTLSPPTDAPALQLPWELMSNFDTFRGAPIVPQWQLGLDPEQQFNQYTSEFSKAVGKAIHVSPAVIDHVIVSIGGSWARDAINVSNMMLNQDRGATLYDFPVTGRFVKNLLRGNDATDKFYAMISQTSGDLERKMNTYQGVYIAAGDTAGAADYWSKLTDQQKVWVASQTAESAMEKRVHPLRRAKDVMGVYSGLQRDIVNHNVKSTLSGQLIPVNPTMARAINDQLARAAAAEARNAMIVIGAPGWAQREIIDPQPFLDHVKSLDPKIAREIDDRLYKVGALSFAGVEAVWPSLKQRLLQKGPGAFTGDLAAAAMHAPSYIPPAQSAPRVFAPSR